MTQSTKPPCSIPERVDAIMSRLEADLSHQGAAKKLVDADKDAALSTAIKKKLEEVGQFLATALSVAADEKTALATAKKNLAEAEQRVADAYRAADAAYKAAEQREADADKMASKVDKVAFRYDKASADMAASEASSALYAVAEQKLVEAVQLIAAGDNASAEKKLAEAGHLITAAHRAAAAADKAAVATFLDRPRTHHGRGGRRRF